MVDIKKITLADIFVLKEESKTKQKVNGDGVLI